MEKRFENLFSLKVKSLIEMCYQEVAPETQLIFTYSKEENKKRLKKPRN